MKRDALLILLLLAAALPAAAQQPLYIVNGEPRQEISSIPPEEVEQTELLPADEQTIARYGPEASHGVMLITLRYDAQPTFPADSSFSAYIARQVKWPAEEPAARVVLRYTISESGETLIGQELESTDNRLKRRIMKAVEEAPRWIPAQKNGKSIATEGVLHIQLPEGKQLIRPLEVVFR